MCSLFDGCLFASSRWRRQAEAYPARSHSAGFYKCRPHFPGFSQVAVSDVDLWTSKQSSCQGLPEVAAGVGWRPSRERSASHSITLKT